MLHFAQSSRSSLGINLQLAGFQFCFFFPAVPVTGLAPSSQWPPLGIWQLLSEVSQSEKVNLSFLSQNQIRTLAKYQPCLRRDSATTTLSEACFVYLLEEQYRMILTLLFALREARLENYVWKMHSFAQVITYWEDPSNTLFHSSRENVF